MFSQILNYSIRGLIVIIGLILISGLFIQNIEPTFRISMGIIFVLFGIYRITLYYTQQKRYQSIDEDDE